MGAVIFMSFLLFVLPARDLHISRIAGEILMMPDFVTGEVIKAMGQFLAAHPRSGLAASEVSLVPSGLDLVFKLANGTDQVMVKNWFVRRARGCASSSRSSSPTERAGPLHRSTPEHSKSPQLT